MLKLVGLGHAIDQKIGGFSTGMLKRFGLAQALINEPSILFLDEPTSGIDPLGAQEMRDLVRKLKLERGVTVFLSSHSMTEVEEICDRIGVISKGRLIAVGTVEELRDKVREREGVRYLLEVSGLAAKEVALALEQIGSVRSVEVSDGGLRLLADVGVRMEIAEVVKRSGGVVTRFEEERMDLQRVFLRLIGA